MGQVVSVQNRNLTTMQCRQQGSRAVREEKQSGRGNEDVSETSGGRTE